MNFKAYIRVIIFLFSLLAPDAYSLPAPKLLLPNRPPNALGGTQFLSHISKLNGAKREQAIVQEVLRGNVPNFERFLTPIEKRISSGIYRGQILRYWVLPDYLAIGSDHDFVRVPLNVGSIKILSDKLNFSLPTTKMVDEIYAYSKIKLSPRPLPLRRDITSTQNIARHESIVRRQLAQAKPRPGTLVAGHKKDVVQTRRLLYKPRAIAIYGWHRTSNKPIQPLSTIHRASYADYSHGVRLVSNAIEIGQKRIDLRQALSEKGLANQLSYEGVSPKVPSGRSRKGYPIASR